MCHEWICSAASYNWCIKKIENFSVNQVQVLKSFQIDALLQIIIWVLKPILHDLQPQSCVIQERIKFFLHVFRRKYLLSFVKYTELTKTPARVTRLGDFFAQLGGRYLGT
jgi:hypothetical protein